MRHSPLSTAGQAPAAGPGQALRPAGGPDRALRRPVSWPALVAVAHGSSDPRAAAAVTALISTVSARLRASGLPGIPVHVAYLGHALPPVPAVLESLRGHGHAVVLPLLLTPAYHSDTDLPAVLSQAASRLAGMQIRYGRPLGPDPLLAQALEHRLAQAGQAPAAGTAVVLAAAGSSRPQAAAAVAAAAAAWQASGSWRAVVPAYASAASPSPAQAVAGLLRAGAARVAVASYLLAPGLFADRIAAQSLAAGAAAVSAPLGAHPAVADLVVRRYLQAAAGGT